MLNPNFAIDTLNGGDGNDTVSFRQSWEAVKDTGVTFNLDTHSSNFENIIGSNYSDNLTGNSSANVITGDNREHNYGEGDDIVKGLGGNDTLEGNGGDDQLDGGTGADIITTGSGNDVIILRAGDGGSSLSGADIIKDFTDGLDSFGLADGLQYSDLTIAQGTADNANNTIISKGSEYLAIVENFAFGSMTEVDTTTI
ncbi:MAG: hypothetical protein P8L82_07840 [Paracoccaceae bacterium]|nr:hypothetical protein [Paracoccaceae bacterium]